MWRALGGGAWTGAGGGRIHLGRLDVMEGASGENFSWKGALTGQRVKERDIHIDCVLIW